MVVTQCAIMLSRFKLPDKIECVKITIRVNPHFVIHSSNDISHVSIPSKILRK